MVSRMADVGRAFAAERVAGRTGQAAATITTGIAVYPADGETLLAVLRAAAAAATRAKVAGAGSVEASGGTHIRSRAERVDVLVAEDDTTVQGLLLHALATRGYRTRAVGEGPEVVSMLTGPEPEMIASLVLLDVELPGMNGLSVLRRLSLDGVLGRTRVIMVTGRSGEEEVLEALATGAFDHVAKPFSVPILPRRCGSTTCSGRSSSWRSSPGSWRCSC
jgi:CheY-like chemotaxis protein